MSSRDLCLSAALRLFNERGSHAITTNRIAAEAGVSVGNLYYHFRSKEAIVLALFESLDEAWRTRLTVPDPARVTWDDLDALMAEHFAVVWQFRFFYREQVSLRQNDRMLARRWAAANERGKADLAALLTSHLALLGAPPPRPADLARLTDACWLIADFWLVHREIRTGPVHRADLDEGVEFFRSITRPLVDALAPTPPPGDLRADR